MQTVSDAAAWYAEVLRRKLARLWLGMRLSDVMWLTSVPILIVVLFIGDGVLRSYASQQFDDWWTSGQDVDGFVTARARATLALPRRVGLRQDLTPRAPDPGIIRIDVPQRDWDAIQRDPQEMWGEWIDATLTYGATSLDVSLRKRGDNSIHWLTDKRSFTVRTSRTEFYKSYREFSLSVKDVLPSFVASQLAAEFDLLVASTSVVPVYLNNQLYGVFLLRELVDESFLRRVERMPGNVYRGDTAGRGEAHKGTQRNLFVNPYTWDRVAFNDRWTAAPPDGLLLMLEDLHGGTFEDHRNLMARFDIDEYARLFAYLMVVGDPFHSSGINNQFLYEDPSTQQLHPIPWDIRLRELTAPGAFNDLFRELLRNPWLTDRIMHEVARSLSDRRIVQVAETLVVDVETRYHDYFEYDRLRTGLVPPVGTADASLAMIQGNARTLERWLETDTVAVSFVRAGQVRILDFEARGLVGADLLALDGVAPEDRPHLYLDQNRNGVLDSADPEVRGFQDGGSFVLNRPTPLLSGWNTRNGTFEAGRLSYRFFVTGVATDGVRPRLANRVTGAAPETVTIPLGQTLATSTAWHPWMYPEHRSSVHRFSGMVRLGETVRIAAGDTVLAAPGTTFSLGPDVSFISRGVVRFEGTRDEPIRVVPSVADQPWGAFSVLGAAADGSVFRNVEFVGGGGGLVDRIEFVGMVNVHWVRGAIFDSVLFMKNRRSDDAFHALHADVELTESRFIEANSDAVDFDNSVGEIRGNYFDGSGGDAIDLMTSRPRIIANHIRRAGDKGISVGEASAPIVFANSIESGVIGIEIKDGSTPLLLNNDIRDNQVAIGSHAKNWRYGSSGFGFIANTRLEGNTTAFSADSASRVTAVSVGDLDGGASEASEPVALDWLYGSLGIRLRHPVLGVPEDWSRIEASPPVAELRFVDDFESVADGWRGGPRITRLEKRHGALIVEAEGRVGEISCSVDWDLSAEGGVLVAEVAGRDIRAVRLEAEGDLGSVERELFVLGDPARFMVAEIPLPAGRYHRVTLKIEPTPGLTHIQPSTGLSVVRAGRLLLRSISVYSANRDGAGRK